MVRFPKIPSAARHIFISTDILRQEKKFMNEIIKWKHDYRAITCI